MCMIIPQLAADVEGLAHLELHRRLEVFLGMPRPYMQPIEATTITRGVRTATALFEWRSMSIPR